MIKARDFSFSYGPKIIFDNINFSIDKNIKVGLVGPNGAGKSTFLKILLGRLLPDQGEVIKDENLKIGYYSQEFETFDFNETVMETCQKVSLLPVQNIRQILGRFLFSGDKIYQSVGSLSGGEKTRLAIALILMQDSNVLILDEPTTYLDTLSQRIILEAIKIYQGAMVVVSHTEEFIAELKPDRAIILPEQLIDVWYPEFLNKVAEV